MEFQLQTWVHHIKIDVNLSKLENEYEDGDLILEKPLKIEELATFSPKIIIKDLQTRAVVGGPLTRNFAFHMEHVRYIIIKEDQLQFTEVSLSGEKICLRRLQSAPRKLDRSSPPKLNNRNRYLSTPSPGGKMSSITGQLTVIFKPSDGICLCEK